MDQVLLDLLIFQENLKFRLLCGPENIVTCTFEGFAVFKFKNGINDLLKFHCSFY